MFARRWITMAALVAAGALGTAATATAAHATTHTFDGSCSLDGALVFAQPLGDQLRPTTFTDTASGTCSGTLDGQPVVDLPTTNTVNGLGVLSCAGGHALSSDVLDFGDNRTLHIASDSFAVLTGGVSHFDGWSAGDGIVVVQFAAPDQTTLDQCQAGTLSQASYHLTARTLTPVTG